MIAGCSRSLRREQELIGEQYYFDRGMEMMKKKDYPKAVENFQIVVDSYASSSIVDHAQFMLAEAHFNSEEFISASYEYERVYKDYPSSKFAPEAHYKKALCYYMESPIARLDQDNTIKAIDEFNRFIDTYSSHPLVDDAQEKIDELRAKLAYKEYLNAQLYLKLKEYDSALIYYRYVISEYPRTIWAQYARFGIGEVHFRKEEFETAQSWYQLIVNADVDAELKEKAVKRLSELENTENK